MTTWQDDMRRRIAVLRLQVAELQREGWNPQKQPRSHGKFAPGDPTDKAASLLEHAQRKYAAAQRLVEKLHPAVAKAIAAGHYFGPAHEAFNHAIQAREAAGRRVEQVKSALAPTPEQAHQIAYWQDTLEQTRLARRQEHLEERIDRASADLESASHYDDHYGQHAAQVRLDTLQAQHTDITTQLREVAKRLHANPVNGRLRDLPPTVIKGAGTNEHGLAMFGKVLADHEWAGLVGAQRGDMVEVATHPNGFALHLHNSADFYEAERSIFLRDNAIHIHNDALVVEDGGRGIGVRLFAAQVRMAAQLGVQAIETVGGQGTTHLLHRAVDMNGYYTWPRLGYNADLKQWLAREASDDLDREITTVRDLMQTAEGRDWWKRNGYQIDLTFDLTPGSQSRQDLKAYLDAKGYDSTGIERMQTPQTQQPNTDTHPSPHWVDLDWTDEDEAAANRAVAQQQAAHMEDIVNED